MDPLEELKKKLDEALNQVAVEQLRADEAEKKVKELDKRASEAEATRDSLKTSLETSEKARADAATQHADSEGMRRKVEVLQAQLGREKQRADSAESSDNIRKLVKARVAIESDARMVLGDSVARLDELDDLALMAKVIERLETTSLEGKNADYVRARFDAAVSHYKAGADAQRRIGELQEDRSRDNRADPTRRADSRNPREKFIDEQNNLWRPAPEKGAGQ